MTQQTSRTPLWTIARSLQDEMVSRTGVEEPLANWAFNVLRWQVAGWQVHENETVCSPLGARKCWRCMYRPPVHRATADELGIVLGLSFEFGLCAAGRDRQRHPAGASNRRLGTERQIKEARASGIVSSAGGDVTSPATEDLAKKIKYLEMVLGAFLPTIH